jgi:Astacin (Peptidase family M12A)
VRIAVITLAGIALLLGAGPAEAYEIGGKKWPRGRVSYFVAAKQHATAISKAVRAWNGSGARIRFSRTRSRRRANLVIAYKGSDAFGCSEGLATVGRATRARLYLPRLREPSPYGELVCLRTVVHELGHVLGLTHENETCATMNSIGINLAPDRCPRHPPWAWRCRLLEVDDVRGAVIRYGGRVRPVKEPPECELYPSAPPVGELTTSFDPRFAAISVSFRHPASPVPSWLRDIVGPAGGPQGGYTIQGARDVCPVAPVETPFAYSSAPNEIEQHQLPIEGPGNWCVSVWHVDELSRPSGAPASQFIEVR